MRMVNKKTLDLSKLKIDPSTTVSSEKALHDVEPFKWNKEVLDGKIEVVIQKKKEKQEA